MPGSGRARAARSSVLRCISNSSTPPSSQPTNTDVADCSDTNASPLISRDASCSKKKRGRGPTRGLGLAKKIQRGDPIEIVVSDERVVGLSSSDLINEIGIVVRDYSPLHITRWKYVPLEDKNKMWELVRKLSAINSGNRSQQKILHRVGSKGYHRREYEMRNKETGAPPSRLVLWKETHCINADTDEWVDEATKDAYYEVISIKKQAELEGVEISEEEAFFKALGHKSRYIFGRLVGQKRKSASLSAMDKEKEAERDRQVVEARREADEARKEADEAKREADQARKEAATLKQQMAQLNGKVDSMMNLFLQQRTSL